MKLGFKKIKIFIANLLNLLIDIFCVIFVGSVIISAFHYQFVEEPAKFKSYPKYEYQGKEYFKKSTVEINGDIRRKLHDPVIFNIETKIYHEIWCEWAEQCTENCIYMERKKAKKLGRHCYVCEHEPEYDDPDMNPNVPARFQ